MVTAQRGDGVLDPQGPVSQAVADLWWLMLGLGGVVFVAVVVVLALGLFRRPAAEQEPGRERPQRFGRWFVVGGVVAPLLILTIVFGATVLVIEQESQSKRQYTLVGQDEADMKVNRISIQSPVGKALIGKRVGDFVEVKTPVKMVEYEVVEIRFEEL